MALAAASVWQADWANVPRVSDDSWKGNLALFIDDHVSDLLTCSTIFASPGTGAGAFTFNLSAFQGALSMGNAANISAAWETGILASSFVVTPGAFIGTSSPATMFGVVASTVIDPASVALGKAKILEIGSLTPTSVAGQSQFPVKLREAFLLLTVTVTGNDATPPPAGPIPLTAAGVAVQ